MNRFYVPFHAGLKNLWIDSSESHHIVHVKRLKIGDNIIVFNGMGDESEAEIEEIERKIGVLKLDNVKRCQALALLGAAKTLMGAPEPPLDIIRMILLNFDRIVGIAGLMVGWISLVNSWTS